MADDKQEPEDLDPADWLAKQFGAEHPPVPPPLDPTAPVEPVQPTAPHVPPAEPSPPAQSTAPDLPPTPTPAAPVTPDGGGFSWGLAPGASAQPPAEPPPAEPPPAEPPPATPPVDPIPPTPPPYVPYTPPPLTEPPAAPPPATVPTSPYDQPTQAMDADQFGADLAAFEPPPVDASLAGATEVLGAHEIGIPDPTAESLAHSPLESLFGETQFRDYEGEPMIGIPTTRQTVLADEGGAPPPRTGMPRTQKILMSVAGGLVGILAIVALFLLGTRIAGSLGAAPAVTADPTPTPSASALPTALGPVAPGEYRWDELLGGECLEPYESPWQDEYTVVDCTTPHAAQILIHRSFADPVGSSYPGLEELQSRINLLCTAPTVLDYAIAGGVTDLRVSASFAVDVDEWDAGNTGYYCFVDRAGGEPLGVSVALPQVAPPTPTPTPAP